MSASSELRALAHDLQDTGQRIDQRVSGAVHAAAQEVLEDSALPGQPAVASYAETSASVTGPGVRVGGAGDTLQQGVLDAATGLIA